MKHIEQLNALNACLEAIEWAETQPDWETCWAECPQGDWLLWAPGLEHKTLVLAACACARLVLHLVPEGEDRPRVAIETTEAWARGEASLAEVEAASNAAAAAAEEAWAEAAARAAEAWAAEAWAAVAAAEAVVAAVDAAWWAARAAWWATDEAARVAMHLQCADIVRSFFPKAPDLAAIVREATA